MNFPFTLQLGNVDIQLHVIFETAAFIVGFRYFLYLRKKRGDHYESGKRAYIIIGAIFGALVGSRLIGSLERPYELLKTDNLFWYIYHNKTVLGGFLGGLFGVELIKKVIKENRASGDLFVYPMILALVIGRIGCFSMGIYEETYGTVTIFFAGMNLGDGQLRHPVAAYEIFFLLFLWIGLSQNSGKISFENGVLFKLFMIAYLLFRFCLDFIKPHYNIVIGLSTIQLTSLLGLFYYLPFIMTLKKR